MKKRTLFPHRHMPHLFIFFLDIRPSPWRLDRRRGRGKWISLRNEHNKPKSVRGDLVVGVGATFPLESLIPHFPSSSSSSSSSREKRAFSLAYFHRKATRSTFLSQEGEKTLVFTERTGREGFLRRPQTTTPHTPRRGRRRDGK